MSAAHHPSPKKNGHGGGYEKQDVGFRFAMVFVSALIAAVIVVLIFLVWFYRVMVPPAPSAQTPVAQQRPQPPAPVLQANPAADMQKFREREEQKASTYGWVDEKGGIAHVPVERAMEMVAERGLPQWQPPKATQEKKP
ncbi:MAG: hypothetical protein KatS3mg023_1572 [Armatimonadota bacterium]|nr:MAG: hypothetical protein KatS3mg023_1572 [Armatimonadota bacterium]